MHLSEAAIRNHVFTWMVMFGLIFFGAIAFNNMGISLTPDVDFPVATVRVQLEGAAPEVIEKSVIEPIEAAVSSVEGIRSIVSTIITGNGNVSVEFDLDRDIDVAIQELQSRLARIQRQLPRDIEAPVITKSNPDDRPIMYLVLYVEGMSLREMMLLARNRIVDQLSSVRGVAEVTPYGYVEPNIRVDLKTGALKRYQLTANDIVQAIQRESVELPSGYIVEDDKEKILRVQGEVSTAKALSNVFIKRRGGGPNYNPITIGDVADVYEGLDEVRRISRVDGRPAIAIGVRKQRGSNAVKVSEGVVEKMNIIQQSLPDKAKLTNTFDNTVFIKEAVHELVFTICIAALLTSIVCWLFLGSWAVTLNVILAIPTSIVGSFIIINMMGFTLNTFTLLGLSLAIGIVVDDAIIVLENIFRHQKKAKSVVQGAISGSREITFAVTATSIAVISIFLPVAFMDGAIGKFFFQFAVTISVAVALSLFEALMLAPMRLSQFKTDLGKSNRLTHTVDRGMNRLAERYGNFLTVALQHKTLVLVVTLVIFAASLFVLRDMKKEFAPAQDEGRAFIQLKTPEGSALSYTNQRVQTIENLVKDLSFVERYYVSVGGFGSGGESNLANLIVFFKDPRPKHPKTGKKYTLKQIGGELREIVNGVEGIRGFVRVSFNNAPGGRGGYPVEFTVQGGDFNVLRKSTKQLIEHMEKSGMLTGIQSDNLDGRPEFHIYPNREAAKAYGVDVEAISNIIMTTVNGINAASYSHGGRRYDIRVQLPDADRHEISELKNLYVHNNRGEIVPIMQVINLSEESGPLKIRREGRERGIQVTASLSDNASQGEALKMVAKIAKEVLPPGYYISFSGSSKTFSESFQNLILVLVLGLIISYMVLASQFNSFNDPLAILSALPLSFSGAFFTLYVTGQTINVYSVIGLILLMGIAKKNGILFVEFANQLRDRGLALKEAIIESGKLRLRPILMTSFATMAATLPVAINFGPGAETRVPMAIAVLGGVFFSTTLTLGVVPVVYALLTSKRQHLAEN